MTTYVSEGVFAPARHGRRRASAADTRVRPAIGRHTFPASHRPLWSAAISRVAATSNHRHVDERLVQRARAEFLEMPGLCLTMEQAQRLWGLDPRTCRGLLNGLIDSRFLRRTDRGLFVLCTPRGSGGPARDF